MDGARVYVGYRRGFKPTEVELGTQAWEVDVVDGADPACFRVVSPSHRVFADAKHVRPRCDAATLQSAEAGRATDKNCSYRYNHLTDEWVREDGAHPARGGPGGGPSVAAPASLAAAPRRRRVDRDRFRENDLSVTYQRGERVECHVARSVRLGRNERTPNLVARRYLARMRHARRVTLGRVLLRTG